MSATLTLAAQTGQNATVLNGALFVALPIAVLGGLVSFFSPCVLPLVPGYLAALQRYPSMRIAGDTCSEPTLPVKSSPR